MPGKDLRARIQGAATVLLLQVALLSVPLVFGTARAGWTEDAELGAISAKIHAATITACDRALASGRLTSEEKAVTHFNPGMWRHKARGDYGKANP